MNKKLIQSISARLTTVLPSEIVFYSFIIGIFSGLSASLFYYVLEFMKHFLNNYLTGHSVVSPVGEHIMFNLGKGLNISWLFFILPAIGGLISGLLVYYFAPSAKGNGTDAYIEIFHRKKGEVNPSNPLVKAIASIFVISTNGSSGREGPILQVCGGIGSLLAGLAKKNTIKKRILLVAGAAGGLGAIFRAPLGGALTSIEVLYREDFETEALLPSIISSVTAYSVFSLIFGHKPIFSIGAISFNISETPYYILLGLLCAAAGWLYIRMLDFMRLQFDSLKIKPYLSPMIGGVLVGVVGLFCHQALGSGFGTIQEALFGKYTLIMFLIIALGKMLTTTLTIGSGASGGLFAPTLTIGAMIGGFMVSGVESINPGAIEFPVAFVIVGMASFFAGVVSAPIAAILMVCEITQSYALLPPLLIVSVISIVLSKKSIFRNQVKNKLFSMAHHQEAAEAILKQKFVRDIFKAVKQDDIVYEDMKLQDMMSLIQNSHNSDFIVIDQKGNLVGGLSLAECKAGSNGINCSNGNGNGNGDDINIGKVARKISYVSLDDDLYYALKKFLNEPFYKLPVVDKSGIVQGYLRYRDILTAL